MLDTTGVFLLNGIEPWYIKYLVPAILTLMIGILSFFLSQLYIRHLDKIRSREKYLGYLRVIREEIKRNLDLLCQLHAYLYVNAYPTFKLSFFVGDEIFSGISTICLNYELLNEIFYRYFDYRHIQNRLDRIQNIRMELSEIKSQGAIDQYRKHNAEGELRSEIGGTIGLIEGNIAVSFNTYNQATDEMNIYLKEKLTKLPVNYLNEKYDQFQVSPDVLGALSILKSLDPNVNLDNRAKFYLRKDIIA
jgi:hypothetical protein